MTTLLASALVLALASLPQEEADRPDLTGQVLDRKGEPIAGATVFVYTAAVRKGVSPL